MLDIGRVCMKIAGRDAGKVGVIIDVLEAPYVLIDGEVRRRKCNILHLEPLERKVEIKKNASHADVVKALGIVEPKKRKEKKKEKAARPRHVKKAKVYATAKVEKKKTTPKKGSQEKKK